MLELTGMLAIASVFVGSVLAALFAGEAIIRWTVQTMSVGVRRADEAALKVSGQPQSARPVSGQRPRLVRI